MSEDEQESTPKDKITGIRTNSDHDPDLYNRIKDLWIGDHEVDIYRTILRRENKRDSYPDREDAEAMEELVHRLLGASILFVDLTMGPYKGMELRLPGLSFLARAINRETLRLYRLYHGHPPRD